MTKPVWIALGLLLVVMGTIFGLQGAGYLSGSGMSGKTVWVIIGPIIALLGIVMIVRGLRKTASR